MAGFGQWDPKDLWQLLLLVLAALMAIIALLLVGRRSHAADVDVLLWLNQHDKITVHQAYEGIFAVGATGSGKSSTLEHVMSALMKRGAGMLILTAGVNDYEQIQRVAKRCGREQDLRRFCPEGPYRFDFLDCELSSPGGSVTTAGQLLQDVVDFTTRTSSTNALDPFWPQASGRLCKMLMTLVHRARRTCSISDVYRMASSLPPTKEATKKPEFPASFCGQILLEVAAKGDNDDAFLASDYVLCEWPGMGEKTQGNILAQAMNVLEKFMSGTVRTLISSGETNLSPQDVLDGKIVVVDLPILKFRESGQAVQIVWKIMTQRAALRRESPDRDVVLWADEAQLHALPGVDSMTQAVARKHRLIQVAITQSLPLLFSVLKNRDDAISWISNLQTKFIFANGDRETNEYFSALCGQSVHLLGSSSVSNKPYDLISDLLGSAAQGNYSCAEQFLPDVRPEEFTWLRKGGKENNNIVDCLVFQGGRIFSNGNTWVKASIRQPAQ